MIFRNDDVSANSIGLKEYYDVLTSRFPDCEIYSCTNVFAKSSHQMKASVYPDLPLKDKPLDYFLDVDKVKNEAWFMELDFPNVKIVSHGLWHFDHTAVQYDLKKASIISSCRILHTDIFVPPFNRWDIEMDEICKNNGITMIKSELEGWKSFEHNKFDLSLSLWYFHSWRWTPGSLKAYLNG